MPEKSVNNKLKKLENENALLKKELALLKSTYKNFNLKESKTVKVPESFQSIFTRAEKIVGEYFKELSLQPSKGTIEINSERYVLVRASALSHEFLNAIMDLYKDRGKEEALSIGKNILFDIGHVLGMEDAKKFHKKMKLKDPLEKLSAGPVHFAYSGWAFVDILPEGKPTPDSNFYLKYKHPYSFEADSWTKNKVKSKYPVCTMNAAYSSGWCQESFGIPLTAVEISCRAKGDKDCTFIMAHPNKINELLDKELSKKKIKVKPEIPYFFERKKIEEELIKKEYILSTAQKIAKIGSFDFNLENNNLVWSDELYNIFQLNKLKTNSKDLYKIYLERMPKVYQAEYFKCVDEAIHKGKNYTFKHTIHLPDGKIKWLYCAGIPVKNYAVKVRQIIGIAHDITDSINQKDKLQSNLREKETLLKEIHHRVKNNLQIVSSLLSLQSETIKDKDAKEKYRESLGRVKSMALIHEMLYQTKNLSNIKAAEYLNQLINFISETYNFNRKIKVNLEIDSKIKRIDMNKSVP
ncbi:MAG: XylR N-terminal domain-containing protein, partial [Bacteroidia bacterium]|nr:XylR N-terminal domain-containing protein [Bacteroidia bacterium]